MLNFFMRRRAVLRLPLTTVTLYLISGLLGLSAKAASNRVWKINASSYAFGIGKFFELLKASATMDGTLPVSSLLWYFPLNPTAPDTLQRLAKRPSVTFDTARALAAGPYESLDFKDAQIGAVSVVLPTQLLAKYAADATTVSFEFEGNDAQLAQVILWNIPKELGMPKALRVKALSFQADGTTVVLSNTVNATLLEMRLFTTPVGVTKVTLASAERLSATDAFMMLAANTTVCCNGNCVRDDGAIGGENGEISTRYAVVKRVLPPNSGQCSIATVKKDSPPLGNDYTVIAGGFYTYEAAADAMNTKYKKECTPP